MKALKAMLCVAVFTMFVCPISCDDQKAEEPGRPGTPRSAFFNMKPVADYTVMEDGQHITSITAIFVPTRASLVSEEFPLNLEVQDTRPDSPTKGMKVSVIYPTFSSVPDENVPCPAVKGLDFDCWLIKYGNKP